MKKRKMFIEFIKMFWICTYVGAQMFGSGMAVMPILQKEFIEKRKWITNEELLDYMSISKCTPGSYTVNIVAFIGNKRRGILGGLAASVGIIIAPIIAVILFAMLYHNISDMEAFNGALIGITVCVCALIINSLIALWKNAIINLPTLAVFVISFLLYTFTDISIIIIIFGMGIAYFGFEKYLLPKSKAGTDMN